MQDRIYGYEIVSGRLQVKKTEAKIIRNIFDEVLNENSLMSIAGKLNNMEILVRKKNGNWTHSMVSNIVKNRRYCGELGYPKIINKNIQDKAAAMLKNKALHKGKVASSNLNKESPFYKKVECKTCGRKIWLYDHEGIRYWHCASVNMKYNCKTYRKWEGYLDIELQQLVLSFINELINDPMQIQYEENVRHNNLEIVKIENEIKNKMNRVKCDMCEIRRLLAKKYSMKYLQYEDDKISETVILKKRLSEMKHQDKLTHELVSSVIRKITIDRSGTVSIILLNDQIMKRTLVLRKVDEYGKDS